MKGDEVGAWLPQVLTVTDAFFNAPSRRQSGLQDTRGDVCSATGSRRGGLSFF